MLIPSTPDFHKNLNTKVKLGQEPCAICGRGVDVSKNTVRYIYTVGGSDMCSESDMKDNGGWAMPVGPDCWKKHPEIHEYEDLSE